MNYELKHPNPNRSRKILISEDATFEELRGQYAKEFKELHGHNPLWTPSPLSKEWLVDQLQAMDWYLPIPVDYVTEAPKVKTRKRSKEPNPFK